MRDYAKLIKDKDHLVKKEGRQARPDNPEGGANWLLRLMIVALIAFVGFSAWRHYVGTVSGVKRVTMGQKIDGSTASHQNTVFDFYTVLPKGNTPAAPTDTAATASTNAPSSAPSPSNTSPLNAATQVSASAVPSAAAGPYYLLIGSYQDQSAAQEVRSQLLLLNVPASVAQSGSDFRVLVGPFNDLNTLNSAKDQLKSQGVDSSQA